MLSKLRVYGVTDKELTDMFESINLWEIDMRLPGIAKVVELYNDEREAKEWEYVINAILDHATFDATTFQIGEWMAQADSKYTKEEWSRMAAAILDTPIIESVDEAYNMM